MRGKVNVNIPLDFHWELFPQVYFWSPYLVSSSCTLRLRHETNLVICKLHSNERRMKENLDAYT